MEHRHCLCGAIDAAGGGGAAADVVDGVRTSDYNYHRLRPTDAISYLI